MKKAVEVTITLDEGIYTTLKFVADTINKPLDAVILNALYNQVDSLQDFISQAFDYNDKN